MFFPLTFNARGAMPEAELKRKFVTVVDGNGHSFERSRSLVIELRARGEDAVVLREMPSESLGDNVVFLFDDDSMWRYFSPARNDSLSVPLDLRGLAPGFFVRVGRRCRMLDVAEDPARGGRGYIEGTATQILNLSQKPIHKIDFCKR